MVTCTGALVNIKQNGENYTPGWFQGGGSTAWLAVELTAGFPLSRETAPAERMAATVLVTDLSVFQSMKSEVSLSTG